MPLYEDLKVDPRLLLPCGRNRVFLVGLSGAGKSSAARLAARRLGWAARDTDAEVERRTGRSIAALFAARGEAAFRAYEQSAALELAARPRQVVALGGGAFQECLTRRCLLKRGLVVWLKVDPDEAARRLAAAAAAEPRPLLRGDPAARLRAQLAERAPAYGQAHLRIDTNGRSAAEVAAEVAAEMAAQAAAAAGGGGAGRA